MGVGRRGVMGRGCCRCARDGCTGLRAGGPTRTAHRDNPRVDDVDAADAPPTPTADAPEPQPAPADPAPAAKEPTAASEPAPTGGAPADSSTPPASSTPASSTPASTEPAGTVPAPASTAAAAEPTSATKDIVKLEPPAPAAASAAPSATSPAASAPQPTAQPATSAQPTISIELAKEEPSSVPETPATTTNVEAAAAADALIVSLRPRAAAPPISLPPTDGPVLKTTSSARSRPVRAAARRLIQPSCARPAARVPLSLKCVQVRADAVLRVTLPYAPSPEVRAALVRAGARITVRKVDARPPPEAKAAEKHPVAKARPIVPFGNSGQGVAHDGFNGSTGSTSSSRAVRARSSPLAGAAAVPVRAIAPAHHASARRDRRSSHRSTRIAPSTIPNLAGREDPGRL